MDGFVNLTWPHCSSLIWPHLVVCGVEVLL